MKHLGLKTLLLAVLLSFVFVACNETTTPTANKPEAPTNIRATSKSSTAIIIKWDLSTSESDAKFTGYTLEITPGPFQPISIQKGVTTYTQSTGLTEGTVYTFKLYAVMDGVESATAATINWSPATRFDLNVNSNPIYIFESASSFGSGLDLNDLVGNAPKTLTVASGAQWNLALDTRTSGETVVASPTMVDYNYGTQPGVTEISSDGYPTDDLDNVFDSQALNADPSKFAERSIDLEAMNQTTGIVLILRTKEGTNTEFTYAKVLIKKTGGSWLQGTAPNRYIECVVSYQHTPGVPYAF